MWCARTVPRDGYENVVAVVAGVVEAIVAIVVDGRLGLATCRRGPAPRMATVCIAIVALWAQFAPPAAADGASDVARAGGAVSAAKKRANALAAALDRAESQAAATDGAVDDAQRAVDAATGAFHTASAGTARSAIEAYVSGVGASAKGSLATAGASPLAVASARVYGAVARGNQVDVLDRLRAASLDLARANATLRRRLAAQQQSAAAISSAQAKVVAELSGLEANLAKAKDQASRDAAAAIARGRALASAPAAGGGPAVLPVTGSWTCPVQGPVAFTNDFGAPRYGGGYHTHKGNDILAPRGAPVVANVSGVFAFNNNGLGGLSYNLTGADGTRYYGAHLDRFSGVHAGQVSQGTVLGFVGNSGDARGGPTHLHYEVHPHGGAAVNPYPLTSRYC